MIATVAQIVQAFAGLLPSYLGIQIEFAAPARLFLGRRTAIYKNIWGQNE